jgi:hypothetical protein
MISRRPAKGSRVVAVAPVDDYQPIAGSPRDIVTLVQRTKICDSQKSAERDSVLASKVR